MRFEKGFAALTIISNFPFYRPLPGFVNPPNYFRRLYQKARSFFVIKWTEKFPDRETGQGILAAQQREINISVVQYYMYER